MRNSLNSTLGMEQLENRDMPSITPFSTEPDFGANSLVNGWSTEPALQNYRAGVLDPTKPELRGAEGVGKLETQTVTPKFEVEVVGSNQIRIKRIDFQASQGVDFRNSGVYDGLGNRTNLTVVSDNANGITYSFPNVNNPNFQYPYFWLNDYPGLPAPYNEYGIVRVKYRYGQIFEAKFLPTNALITGTAQMPMNEIAYQKMIPARDTASLVVKNTGNLTVQTPLSFPINPGQVVIRPGDNETRKLKWVSPVDGLANVKSVLTDLETAYGDGVSYKLTHTTRVVSEKNEKFALREAFVGPMEEGMSPEKLVRYMTTKTKILAQGVLNNSASKDITNGGMDLLVKRNDVFELEITPVGTLNSMHENKGDATRTLLKIDVREKPRELTTIEEEAILKEATVSAILEEHSRMQQRTYSLVGLEYQFNNYFLQNVADMTGPWWGSDRDLAARLRPDLYGATAADDEAFASQYATQRAGLNPPPGEWGFWYNYIIQQRANTRQFIGNAKPDGWEVIKRSLDLTFNEILKEKMGLIPHANGVVGHVTGEANAYAYLPMPTAAQYEAKIRAYFDQCYNMRRNIAQDQAVDQERINFLANQPPTAEQKLQFEQQETQIQARLGYGADRIARKIFEVTRFSQDPRMIAYRNVFPIEQNIARVDNSILNASQRLLAYGGAQAMGPGELVRLSNPTMDPNLIQAANNEVIPSYELAYNEVLSWYSPGIQRDINVREDTIVSRIFLGLFKKLKAATNDIERIHISKLVEKITDIPFGEIVKATKLGFGFEKFEENLRHLFERAQYIDIFSCGELNQPEILGVFPNMTDYTNESTIRVRFDISAASQGFHHALPYVWQNGVQVAPQMPVGEEIKHRLFVKIPVSKVSEQLIFSPMNGRPEVQIGIVTWTPQPSPNQSLPMITRLAKSEEIVVPMSVKLRFDPAQILGPAYTELNDPDKNLVRKALDFGDMTGNGLAKNRQLITWLVDNFLKTNSAESHKMGFDTALKLWKGERYDQDDGTGPLIGECKWWVDDVVAQQSINNNLPGNYCAPVLDGNGQPVLDLYGNTVLEQCYRWDPSNEVNAIHQSLSGNELDELLLNTNTIIRPGDFIQAANNDLQHTMIVGKIEATGIWVFDSNAFGAYDHTPRYRFINSDYLNTFNKFTIYRAK